MSNEIVIEGFEEFFDSVRDMEITVDKERKGIRAALNVLKKYTEPNAPVGATGRTKKSFKIKVKKSGFGFEGVIYVDDWKAVFQEFRNSRQTGRHVGWFARGINAGEGEALQVLQEEVFR